MLVNSHCQVEAGKGGETSTASWFLSLPPYLGVEERSECCAARTYGTKWDRKPRKVGPQTPSRSRRQGRWLIVPSRPFWAGVNPALWCHRCKALHYQPSQRLLGAG